jgi:hypothetical protein
MSECQANVVTAPGEQFSKDSVDNGADGAQLAHLTVSTEVLPFDLIEPFLSRRSLRRPPRTRPLEQPPPQLPPYDRLRELVEKYPPPDEWFEGEEEKPF